MHPNDVDRIFRALERGNERLDALNAAQERHGAVLEEHQRRSEALEKYVSVLEAELKPIKTHVAVAGAVAKYSIPLIGLAVAIWRALS